MCDNNNTVRSHRKTSKPMMEKRRRARINQSLAELKDLIVCCDKYELENCRRTNRAKLEKADILELTVRHLHRLHNGKTESVEKSEDSSNKRQEQVMEKFRDGFHECVQEIERYLNHNEEVALDKPSKCRLFQHLKSRLQGLNVQEQQQHHNCMNHLAPNPAEVVFGDDDDDDSDNDPIQVSPPPPPPMSAQVVHRRIITCDHHKNNGQQLTTGHIIEPSPDKKNVIQVKVKTRANSVQHLIRIRPEVVRVDVWRPW